MNNPHIKYQHLIDGQLALDNAINLESVTIKKIDSPSMESAD